MRLADLVPGAGADVEITGLALDNRRVEQGTLFFCVPGFTRDGHDFAPDAVARGAAALVVERPLGLGVPEVRVGSVRGPPPRIDLRRIPFQPDGQVDLSHTIGNTGKPPRSNAGWTKCQLALAILELHAACGECSQHAARDHDAH